MSNKSARTTKECTAFVYNATTILLLALLATYQVVNAQGRSPIIRNNSTCPGPVVILKADDLGGMDLSIPHKTWLRFFDLVDSLNISASIGIISDHTLESVKNNGPQEITEIINRHNEMYLNELNEVVNRFEFWNHTADHIDLTSTSTNQYDQITNCQSFFINRLSFGSNTFAAPENRINQGTYTAIHNYNQLHHDSLKIWMNYGFDSSISFSEWSLFDPFNYGTANYGHLRLPVTYADDHLDPDANGNYHFYESDFKKNYPFPQPSDHSHDWLSSLIIIEMHPAGYHNDSFSALINVVTYLKAHGAIFVTPTYLYNKANNEHYCGDYVSSIDVNAVQSTMSAGYSGRYPCPANHTAECDHTTVHSGATVNFTGKGLIDLLPGFRVERGATFHAINTVGGSSGGRYASTNIVTDTAPSDSKITLYPNPNEGKFLIDFGLEQKNGASITVYNLNGQEIMALNTFSTLETIDLSNQAAGLYIVKVLSNNGVGTYKIAKK